MTDVVVLALKEKIEQIEKIADGHYHSKEEWYFRGEMKDFLNKLAVVFRAEAKAEIEVVEAGERWKHDLEDGKLIGFSQADHYWRKKVMKWAETAEGEQK